MLKNMTIHEIPYDKILYHYSSKSYGRSILHTGYLKPWRTYYLAVNSEGRFDYGRRSDIPNIFLTDLQPEEIPLSERGLTLGIFHPKIKYCFPISIQKIIEQRFKVFKNPDKEKGSHIYNVPSPDGRYLKINVNLAKRFKRGTWQHEIK